MSAMDGGRAAAVAVVAFPFRESRPRCLFRMQTVFDIGPANKAVPMRRRIGPVVLCLACQLILGAWTSQVAFSQDESVKTAKKTPGKNSKPVASDAQSKQAAGKEGTKKDGQPQDEEQESSADYTFLYMIGGMGLLFYFVVLAPQRRERRKREESLNQLKKHDRVVTIGGIIGTVVSVDSERDEVVLELDRETRVRFLRRSIQGPTAPSDSGESAAANEKTEKYSEPE